MTKLADQVKRHQIAAFFIITFAITWGLGFSYDAVREPDKILMIPLAFVATCGPALAGIIVTRLSCAQPPQGRGKAQWIAFLAALVVSTVVFLVHQTLIRRAPLSIGMAGFILISVIPVAFVISAAWSRIPAVKRYLAPLISLRGVVGWALLAVVLIPGLLLLALPIGSLLGRHSASPSQIEGTGWALIGLIAVKFLYQLLFFNATGEEVGWRGFALPRLQARASPLVASLVLAAFWAPWHFFLWQAEGTPVHSWRFWLEEYLFLIPPTFIIVWLYNRSKGSILVTGFAHAAANTAMAFLPDADWLAQTVTTGLVALMLIGMDRMWRRLPSDHAAVYTSPEPISPPSLGPVHTPAHGAAS